MARNSVDRSSLSFGHLLFSPSILGLGILDYAQVDEEAAATAAQQTQRDAHVTLLLAVPHEAQLDVRRRLGVRLVRVLAAPLDPAHLPSCRSEAQLEAREVPPIACGDSRHGLHAVQREGDLEWLVRGKVVRHAVQLHDARHAKARREVVRQLRPCGPLPVVLRS
eukprot:CAMPEP_0195605360 /NCGR_PEP_ID=MMETSP0815-20121206/7117_1 /TAXON_ID=97485 /ORGANISM="Prymnesium parvum, Strain Texoma1" /LENGTH=164 /DNA_ID=CAMNT_0040745043 /DNA_START=252 /DNA_END=742 /DNA_ORIENTATION=+